MTRFQLIETTRFVPSAADLVDQASAEYKGIRRAQALRQLVIALVLAFIAADVAIALDSLSRL